jgi:hypothetical protein
MGKQRTQVGAYSADNFNDGNQDKIRSVDIGDSLKPNAYESNRSPTLTATQTRVFRGRSLRAPCSARSQAAACRAAQGNDRQIFG